MKRNLFLVFWIVGILMPMAWLVRPSPVAYRIFNTLFSPAWMHILMHGLLFAVLGALLMQRLSGTPARRVGLTLTLVLAAAILQEGFQLLSRQSVLHPDNLFDIGVDMLSGLLGVLAVLTVRKRATERTA
ncbi:MAG: hypothetical protein F4Z82_03875 [Caldilineaceae bacterium SB0668_bin_21]|nr:hypothetical protein [Caldilineaceae bacterium SB0668_bin_21]MYC20398.1 hypothetical protein [Caldilineaceae bacterium SB0662_bin_25]